jgi:hypothetical protein
MAEDTRRIESQAEAATVDFSRRQSITYLECAISLMLTHMSRQEVIAILDQEADDLEEFG